MPKTSWLEKPCAKCGAAVFYLAEWKSAPKECDRCRLSGVNLRAVLDWFLRGQFHDEMPTRSTEEKAFFERMAAQGGKVREALRESHLDDGVLKELCLKDRDLVRVALRAAKERKLEAAPRREGKGFLPKNAGPILQGGLPGLGKKS